MALEFILSWETIKSKINKQNKAGLIAVATVLLLPTLYVILEYFFGLNAAIATLAQQNGVTFYNSMPIAMEYLVFAALFCLTIFLCFGKKGLRGFALPALFAALIGIIYTIDNIFPYGQFTPFQLLVPTTATLASFVLRSMGYSVLPGTDSGMPTLQVTGALGTAKFAIAWPCAGIESLLIFTAVTLLFLQRMPLSWKAKAGYFALRSGHYLLHKCLKNSYDVHHWCRGWRGHKCASSAELPFLLWTTIFDCLDNFLPTDYSCEPRFVAKN